MTAAQINSAILAAIAGGQRSYTVPAGVHTIEAPIRIPGGTSGFELLGGPGVDLQPVAGLGDRYAIEVSADDPTGPISIGPVVTGQRVLTRTGSWTPGWYLIEDDHVALHVTSSTKKNHLAVVRVLDASGTVDRPMPREFGPNPRALPLAGLLSENIRVSGFRLIANGALTGDSRARGLVLAKYVRNLALANLTVEAGAWRVVAVGADRCTDVAVSHCTITGGGWSEFGSGTVVGIGYGVQVNASRFARVWSCTVTACRASIMFSDGTTDSEARNCTVVFEYTGNTPNTLPSVGMGSIDTHGNDERRIRIINCTAPILSLGNSSWIEGSRGVTITGGTYTWLALRPNVRNVTMRGSTLTRFYMDESKDASRMPTDIWLDQVTHSGPHHSGFLAMGTPMVLGNVTLRRVTGASNGWPFVRLLGPGTVNLRVIDCSISGVGGSNPLIDLQAGTHTVYLKGTSAATGSALIRRGGTWSGTFTLGAGNVPPAGKPVTIGENGTGGPE